MRKFVILISELCAALDQGEVYAACRMVKLNAAVCHVTPERGNKNNNSLEMIKRLSSYSFLNFFVWYLVRFEKKKTILIFSLYHNSYYISVSQNYLDKSSRSTKHVCSTLGPLTAGARSTRGRKCPNYPPGRRAGGVEMR